MTLMCKDENDFLRQGSMSALWTRTGLILVLFLTLAGSASAAPGEASGIVVQVESGDTFQVELLKTDSTTGGEIEKVRLADVDSPDIDTTAGQASKEFSEAMLLGHQIWLDIDNKSEGGRGPFGRLICVIYLENPNGTINFTYPFNRILVDTGHAIVNDFDTNEFDPDDWWPDSQTTFVDGMVINEVELNPSGYDEDNEWVELYNKGNESIDIGGWKLSNSQDITLTIPHEISIPPKGFYVVTSEGYWLRNSDEEVILSTERGIEVDRTPILSDDKNNDLSWSRYPDGGDKWEYIPSSKNSTAPSAALSENGIADYEDEDFEDEDDEDEEDEDEDNWLGCCSDGYHDIDPINRLVWDVSEFLR